jgi:hypothetical protein
VFFFSRPTKGKYVRNALKYGLFGALGVVLLGVGVLFMPRGDTADKAFSALEFGQL